MSCVTLVGLHLALVMTALMHTVNLVYVMETNFLGPILPGQLSLKPQGHVLGVLVIHRLVFKTATLGTP